MATYNIIGNVIVNFETADEYTDLVSGENITVMVGKIDKFQKDMSEIISNEKGKVHNYTYNETTSQATSQIGDIVFNCTDDDSTNRSVVLGPYSTSFGVKNVLISSPFSIIGGNGNTMLGGSVNFVFGQNITFTSGANNTMTGLNNKLVYGSGNSVEGNNNTITATNNGNAFNSNHVEGSYNNLDISNAPGTSSYNHMEGYNNSLSTGKINCSHVEGIDNSIEGSIDNSHIEGFTNRIVSTTGCHVNHIEGNANTITGSSSYTHVEGSGNSLTIGDTNTATCAANHIEGGNHTIENINRTHVEGSNNTITGENNHDWIHMEGYYNTLNAGQNCHIEGFSNTVSGDCNHVEGYENVVSGNYNHIEGYENANIDSSYGHIEGYRNNVSGDGFSHAQGTHTIASNGGTTMGQYTKAITNQLVIGKNNVSDEKFAFIIGNGSVTQNGVTFDDNTKKLDDSGRTGASNCFAVDYDGLIYINNSPTGIDISTLSGSEPYKLLNSSSTRLTDANDAIDLKVKQSFVSYTIATSSMTSNKPPIGDSYILSFSWDTTAGYGAQLAIGTGSNNKGLMFRGASSGTFGDWVAVLDTQKVDDSTVKVNSSNQLYAVGAYRAGVVHNAATIINDITIPKSTCGAGSEIFNDYSNNYAIGAYSHIEGRYNVGQSVQNHIEGYANAAYTLCDQTHIEGTKNTASSSKNGHIEGINNVLTNAQNGAHIEGANNNVSANSAHAEGANNTASAPEAHAEGYATTASGNNSHAEGNGSKATNSSCHAGGYQCEANGARSRAWGYKCISNGEDSLAAGYESKTGYAYNMSFGYQNETDGFGTIAIGCKNKVLSKQESIQHCAVAFGCGNDSNKQEDVKMFGNYLTASNRNETVFGVANSTANGQTFAIGCGTYDTNGVTSRANVLDIIDNYINLRTNTNVRNSHLNIMRTTSESGLYLGNTSGTTTTWGPSIITNGTNYMIGSSSKKFNFGYITNIYGTIKGSADYAEYMEWEDGNPNNEDRRGLLVTCSDNDNEFEESKIRLAGKDDDIIGIISSTPIVLGDCYDDEWKGKYKTDIFGKIETMTTVLDACYDEDGKLITDTCTITEPILSDEYDETKEYVSRGERSEWGMVGFLGKLICIDDGTCKKNKYVTAKNGVATLSNEKTNIRMIKRIDEDHIRVLIL